MEADGTTLPVKGLWLSLTGALGLAFWVGTGVAGAVHLVQIVETMVLYTVDTVVPVSTIWLPLDVTVDVTGQVVTYDVTMSVITTS